MGTKGNVGMLQRYWIRCGHSEGQKDKVGVCWGSRLKQWLLGKVQSSSEMGL